MNITTIARRVNERRHRASPILMTGEVITMIGSDGMQEAMGRRWLVPDLDTGFLTVNTSGAKLQEIAEACICKECSKTDCACDAKTVTQESTMPKSMREAWSGMGVGGGSSIHGQTPMMPHQPPPASPTAPRDPRADQPEIGDDVTVVEGGRTFTGRVGTVGQDGRYRISFGNEKPTMDREYTPNEMRVVKKMTNA